MIHFTSKHIRRWVGVSLAAAAPLCFSAETVAPPLSRPAVMSRAASESVLLRVARAGDRLVAVGERGIVILSDDNGTSWRQATVPVSVTLTAVTFPTEREGWAAGHYGVVLHSTDGGETWTRQLDGNTAARIYRDAAVARAAELVGDERAANRLVADAERVLEEGADKPFLDLYFEDANRGFVVGAYNLAFRTEDGGKTWHCISQQTDNRASFHLYGITAHGDATYIVGEQGLLLRSRDGGKSFAALQTPYEGSFFRVARFPTGEIVLAGLRGNAWRSSDGGENWEQVENLAPATITAATVSGSGILFLANQAGQLFSSRDRGRTLIALPTPPLPPLTDLEAFPDGTLIATSMRGVFRLPPTAAAGNDKGRAQ